MTPKRRTLAILVAAFITIALAFAQDQKVLIGKWSKTSETDGDPVQWSLVIKEADGKLSAFLSTDAGEQPAKDFTYTDGVLKFKAPYQGEDYDIVLKAVGEKSADTRLDGTWSGGGASGRTTGKKV